MSPGRQVEADASLDCIGLYCPMPIVNTAKKFQELKDGQVLEILSDDVGILKDMPAWCKATGNKFLSVDDRDGHYALYVQKRSN
ncbi:MAG: sulfurtransferase TusA family protein [Dehalococcoidia bacterium]|nr:sulfurtransferase TusA family protein [Dehalococcoidia bacterium]